MSRALKPPSEQPRYEAPALEKGLQILEGLSAAAVPLSQAEIAQQLDRSPNEIYRMLACLLRRGYIVREASSGKYRLSLRLYELSHTHSTVETLKAAAFAPMRALAEQIRQSVHLSVIQDSSLLVLQQVRSPQPICLSVEEGSRFPLVKTASGRILLAMLPPDERKNVLENCTEYKSLSPAGRKRLLAVLEHGREEGHVLAPSELTPGVVDVAVYIGGSSRRFGAALAVSAIGTLEASGAKIQSAEPVRMLRAAKAAAAEINQALGMVS